MKQIGVIGAGTMGSGIAQVAATAGHDVLIYDARPEALIQARDGLQKILNRLVEKGRMTDAEAKAIFGRCYFLESMNGMRDADLVIEAVVEDLEIKHKVFQSLEAICRSETILATNTSSLSVTSIAGACTHPGRFIGIHFFNPAPLMKLVEVVPAMQTQKEIVDEVMILIQGWGKTTVRAGDTPGFIVNRIARPFYSEALKLYEERMLYGIPDGPAGFKFIDDAITAVGFRMGPFTLMDFIGNDVNYAVTKTVWEACHYEPRYTPSLLQRRLVEAGWLGRKTGRGYYDYREGAPEPEPPFKPELSRMIGDRIITMLMHEAADAVLKGVATPADIDLAMTTGVNYPLDLICEIDRRGVHRVIETMERFYEDYHDPRYRCSPILLKHAREQTHFYKTQDMKTEHLG